MIGKRGGIIFFLVDRIEMRKRDIALVRFEPTTYSMGHSFWRSKRQIKPLSHRPLYISIGPTAACTNKHLRVT